MYRIGFCRKTARALLLLFCLSLLSSCRAGINEELGLNNPAVKIDGNGESTSTEKTEDNPAVKIDGNGESTSMEKTEDNPGAADGRTFLEREKETDPIFAWEDPYADLSEEEIDLLQKTMPQEEYQEYYRTRVYQTIAKTNYPIYYYYYSGRSDYREGYNNENPGYDLLPMTASYAVPESFILNMLADACVVMHVKDSFPVTIERTYQDDEEREKMENMGEEPTYEATNLVFTIDRCVWGDMEDEEIFVFPRFMSHEFIDILSDPSRMIVAFLWKHNDNETGAYNHTGLPEYGMRIRGIFDYTDGKLKTYSNLEDVAKYNGMTVEEMIESGKELAVRYKEALDYVRSR